MVTSLDLERSARCTGRGAWAVTRHHNLHVSSHVAGSSTEPLVGTTRPRNSDENSALSVLGSMTRSGSPGPKAACFGPRVRDGLAPGHRRAALVVPLLHAQEVSPSEQLGLGGSPNTGLLGPHPDVGAVQGIPLSTHNTCSSVLRGAR
jgi:hypothetical protein